VKDNIVSAKRLSSVILLLPLSTINVPANYSGKTYLYYHLVKNKIQDWMFYLVINLCINLFVILYSCSQMRFKLVLFLLTMSVPDEGYCRNASLTQYVLDTIIRKETQIRHEPSYKQLEVKTDRTSLFMRKS
jgi:hypothetical protein